MGRTSGSLEMMETSWADATDMRFNYILETESVFWLAAFSFRFVTAFFSCFLYAVLTFDRKTQKTRLFKFISADVIF